MLSKMGERKLMLLNNFNLFRLYFSGKFNLSPELHSTEFQFDIDSNIQHIFSHCINDK